MTRLLLYIKAKGRGNNLIHLNKNITKIQLLQYLNLGIIYASDKINVADKLNEKEERVNFWLNEENNEILISSTVEKWETIRIISEVLCMLIYDDLKGNSKNEY